MQKLINSIRSKRVLISFEEAPRPATLIIRDGKIEKILGYDEADDSTVDVDNDVILPGIVDTHAHINEPGRTDWEGFATATREAAAGGITTVVDMPLNSIPATTTLQALKIKTESAAGQCMMDYAFWGGVIPGNENELEKMIDQGVKGFKAFLCESGVDEFPMSREADLLKAMPVLARRKIPLLVHAELDLGAPIDRSSHDKYSHYLHSRPEHWEVEAIDMMIRLATQTGCHVHIVHLSAASAIQNIIKAKHSGVPITVETCPHYLFFESEKISDGATHFKCAPPIREHQNREALWKAIQSGVIDCLVSDHSPCTPALKKQDSGDFMGAWGGISGLQFSFQVIWTEMKRRGMRIEQLSERMSWRTAMLAGLSNSKGKLESGFDADFVVFDPEHSFQVRTALIQHKHKVTHYEGFELSGLIKNTYLRGQMIYSDNEKFKFGSPTGRRL